MRKHLFLLFFLITFFAYRPWFFLSQTLSSGDWPYLFKENIVSFEIFKSPFIWLEPYYRLTAKLGAVWLSFSWEITEKIFWFYPFLIISITSSYFLLKQLAKELNINRGRSIFIPIGSLIFITNTYILMLTGGGQMGVAMAYALAPLTLLRIIKSLSADQNQDKFRSLGLSSLIFGIQLMFDPRIFILSFSTGFIYFLFSSPVLKSINLKILKRIIIIILFAILINFFWILPNLNYYSSEYAVATNVITANFLSFATFSNSISLYHPNWPENIFGKIGFMKPEFIVFPILALNSLFFAQKNRTILFFAFLGIVGSFLAKGTNPPFGELYSWLSAVPGFLVFRDPTKFYTLVVLAYMVLIPFCILKIIKKVSSIRYYVLSVFIIFWLFTINPAILGNLTGTFRPNHVPKEYIGLKDFLKNQNEYFTTLWIPEVERFGFNSDVHPAVSALGAFEVSSLSGVLQKVEDVDSKDKLKELKVKYAIVPYDYLEEIFLTDRKYDNKLYLETIRRSKNVRWFSEMENKNFDKIRVFEVIY